MTDDREDTPIYATTVSELEKELEQHVDNMGRICKAVMDEFKKVSPEELKKLNEGPEKNPSDDLTIQDYFRIMGYNEHGWKE